MEAILPQLIPFGSALIAVWMIVRAVRSVLVSRSHLHSFNRRSESLHSKQSKQLSELVSEVEGQIDDLNSEITRIKNTTALRKM